MGRFKEMALTKEEYEDLLRRSLEDGDTLSVVYDDSIAEEGFGIPLPQEVEAINHPPHYTFGKYEVLPVLMDWFEHDPLAWQVCKYMARYKYKGTPTQDLKKAAFYLKELIKNYDPSAN